MTYYGHKVGAQIPLDVQYFKAEQFMCKSHEVTEHGPLIYYQIPGSAPQHKSVA